jgi:neutral ceramidase
MMLINETHGAQFALYLSFVCVDLLSAYNKLERGTIDSASEFLMNSNINRSPSSYLLNPQSERDEYADQGDTDKTMLMLKFMSSHNKPLGALNWFAVHGTSMNNTNQVRGASRGC